MSRGAGRIERAIQAALEAAGVDAVLSVADLCARVYRIKPQMVGKRHRVAVLRAFDSRRLGLKLPGWELDTSFRPARIHHNSNPQRIWAVQITPHGVLWAEAELAGLTKTKVRVRYSDELALLDRNWIAYRPAPWRGVTFTASRSGRIASSFDQQWRARYARPGQPEPMPLDEACALLKLDLDYTPLMVMAAFRREAKKVHPDVGGTADQFRLLLAARARLLATLGTAAPVPRQPLYVVPRGVKLTYRWTSRPSRPKIAPAKPALPHHS
jgi:hypothetical protein